MILNTYLKTKRLMLNRNQKCWLGKSIVHCLKSISADNIIEIKKVPISEDGLKMSVIDYPKEFLESERVEKIVKRFVKKHNISKQEPFNVKKIQYGNRRK